MDEYPLAKHGNFARELEDLQRLGVPAERKPEPESSTEVIMTYAAMLVAWGGVFLIAVALQRLFGVDILLFDDVPSAIILVPVLVVFAMKLFEAWQPVLPEPWPLRGVIDKVLRRWRSVFWFIAIASFVMLLVWTTRGKAVPLLVEVKESGDLGQLVDAGQLFLAAAAAWVPLILCQIAVEARKRCP